METQLMTPSKKPTQPPMSPDFSPFHPCTSQKTHLEGPTVVVQRVVVEVQFGEIQQRVQCIVAVSVFDPPSDPGFRHSGLEGGLGLPDSHVCAVTKRLNGVSCKWQEETSWYRLEPEPFGKRLSTPYELSFLLKGSFSVQKKKNSSNPLSEKKINVFRPCLRR